jgi:hypothetical protein
MEDLTIASFRRVTGEAVLFEHNSPLGPPSSGGIRRAL